MGWFSRRGKEAPTLKELSSGLQTSLRTVHAAIERCRSAHGAEAVDAWRGLHRAVRESTANLTGLLGDAPSPRLERMVALTAGEIWEIAEPYLVAHVPATAEDMAVLRRTLWDRAHAARTNLVEARGDHAARDRLRRLADQVDAGVDALGGGTEEDRQTAAELRRFVNLALG
jgi:hypothetical protein